MLILINLFCFNLAANEIKVDVENTPEGYIFHTDAPLGEFSKSSLKDNNLEEALFKISFAELKESKDWPPAAQFLFYGQNKKTFLNVDFQFEPKNDKYVVLSIMKIHNNKYLGSDLLRFNLESFPEIVVRFKWENNKVSMALNDNGKPINITTPFVINDLVFGIRAAKGKIEVSLPNKLLKQDS